MTDPLGGAGGADPNAQSGVNGDQGTANGGAAGEGAQGGAGQTGTAGDGSASGQVFTQAEYDAVKARMVAADKRASDNEAALKQLRDKDLPEMQKLQRDVAEQAKLLEQATQATAGLRIENAFLTDNTHKWRNPGTALKLLDRSKVMVDSDGTVTGMKDALSALAKSDPYLLEDTAAGDGAATGGAAKPPLGTPPANAGLGGGSKPSADAMAARFPAMRTRLG